MKTAILILAHKNPAQLARLCGALRCPDVKVFVHLDAKADIAAFKGAVDAGAVFIQNRTNIRWGGFSMVEATLNSLREIVSANERFDYLHLISGQDYPVMPMEGIRCGLRENKGKNFISFRQVDENDPADRRLANRYRRYHIETGSRFVRVAVKFFNILFFTKRKPPVAPVYKGSQWFTVTRGCIEYIIRYCDENPGYVRFFRHTGCPDEMFFQNIIMHSPISETVINNNKRYILWRQGSANPETLTSDNFEDIISSGAWFARKFDGDSAVLDKLDKHRLPS